MARRTSPLLLCIVGLLSLSGGLKAQIASTPVAPAAVLTASEMQQQSIAQQLAAITSASASRQADSFRRQAESFQKQVQRAPLHPLPAIAATDKKIPSEPNAPSIQTKPIEEPGPVQTADAQPIASPNAFYSTPWPRSADFVMPNVQVQTNGCDAMLAGEIDQLIKAASGKNGLDPSLLRAVMQQESGLRPCAVSTAGAMGLMQIMPETADDLGLADPFDPAANIDAGARYLKQMLERYHGNTALALAAYNAGPGRTDRANGIPDIPETIGYVSRILSSIPLF